MTILAAGRLVAVTGQDLTATTVLDGLRIETVDATAGANNYAVHCRNCPRLVIANSEIVAGAGGTGLAGAAGGIGNAGGFADRRP
jgi:hypothetical protein